VIGSREGQSQFHRTIGATGLYTAPAVPIASGQVQITVTVSGSKASASTPWEA